MARARSSASQCGSLRLGPVGDDDHQFGACSDRDPKQFGKTQVVTDQRGDGEILPAECGYTRAGFVMFRFAGKRKRLHLAVAPTVPALGSKCHRLVAASAIGPASHEPAQHAGSMLPRQASHKLVRRSAVAFRRWC